MAVKTGFIGLGAMGAPMARNLLKAGIPLVVYDIAPERCQPLQDAGAQAVTCAAAVAREATRIICMVETTAQVRAVMTGSEGVMEAAGVGHRIVCMSTISPKEIVDLHHELGSAGVSFTDAPVSGGVERAITGTLSIFASGDAAVLEAFRDVFASMGSNVFSMGKAGQGMAMKLVNNMLVQVNTVAVAEAMSLGIKAGLDPQMIYDVIKVSTGYSVAFEMRVPRMIAGNFAPGGIMEISYKDQELETTFAKQLGAPMFLAPLTQQIYQIARNLGLAKEDASAIIKVYEQLGGSASS